MSNEVYIVSACRSPIGNFKGQFADVSLHDLAVPIFQSAVKRAGLELNDVSEIYVGNVLCAGKGQNPARQVSLKAGFSLDVSATTLNILCGSGMKAVYFGYTAIKSGEAKVILAAGMESMTRAEHTIFMRDGVKLGNGTLTDSLLNDGLTDAMHNAHMGLTAEEVAKKYDVSRQTQDEFALKSQQKAAAAIKANLFAAEIEGVTVSGQLITTDEFPRPNTTLESLQKLKPAFVKPSGTVTPGNASGMNDGVAALVLAGAEEVRARGLRPLARIVGFAEAGVDPMLMGVAPIPAVRKLLKKIGWTVDDVDRFELNEAFASQAHVINKELGLDAAKVNVNGGGIALGHPIGMSGARILVTLLHEMQRSGAKRGVASLCIGGGMAIAIAVENAQS